MMLKADGFEAATVGKVYDLATSSERLVYSFEQCVGILIKRDGMTSDEAIEYMEFNVTGAYVGYGTPLFIYELID